MSSTLATLILGNTEAEERAMDDVELKRELERAHADCFGWAMACCGRDRDDAEEVLQTVYLTAGVVERSRRPVRPMAAAPRGGTALSAEDPAL